ncbi:DUF2917 domain-containing protein [uncultured Aquabacterium sp.]|jgi:hypothetical protein|uniref:DUF2917 domain-containing protein n=1 Tax=uncultured Aquabacterium sp. TaxID=158753 RepID=UPI00260C3A36|nr:DUF2917 domain-containing protein [uncultured Aquabacterium sp.]
MTSLLHPVLPRLLAALSRRADHAAVRTQKPARAAAPVWSLPDGLACTVVLRRGQALQVHQGRVWLTSPGVADDHFIEAGQHFAVTARTVCVLEGCGDEVARFSVGAAR